MNRFVLQLFSILCLIILTISQKAIAQDTSKPSPEVAKWISTADALVKKRRYQEAVDYLEPKWKSQTGAISLPKNFALTQAYVKTLTADGKPWGGHLIATCIAFQRDLPVSSVDGLMFHTAISDAEAALQGSTKIGDEAAKAICAYMLSARYSFRGDNTHAFQYANQALTGFQKLGHKRGEAHLLVTKGNLKKESGDSLGSFDELTKALVISKGKDWQGEVIASIGYSKDLDCYIRLLEICRKNKDVNGQIELLRHIGRNYEQLGEHDKAVGAISKMATLYQNPKDNETRAEQLINIGSSWDAIYSHKEALAAYFQALEIYQDLKKVGDQVTLLSRIGNHYADRGDLKKAEDTFTQSLVLFKESKDDKNRANQLHEIATSWSRINEYKKALDTFYSLLTLYKKLQDGEALVSTFVDIGDTWLSLGDPKKAIAAYTQALKQSKYMNSEEGQAESLEKLGDTWAKLGEHKKAAVAYSQSISLYPKFSYDSLSALRNLGDSWLEVGEYKKALAAYTNALVHYQNCDAEAGKAVVLASMGDAWSKIGDHRRALIARKQSLSLRQNYKFDGDNAWLFSKIGMSYLYLGDTLKALQQFNQARVHSHSISESLYSWLLPSTIGIVLDVMCVLGILMLSSTLVGYVLHAWTDKSKV